MNGVPYRPIGAESDISGGWGILWLAVIAVTTWAPVGMLAAAAFGTGAEPRAEVAAAFGTALAAALLWSYYFGRSKQRAAVWLVAGILASATGLGLTVYSNHRHGAPLGLLVPSAAVIAASYVWGHIPATLERKEDGPAWFGVAMLALSITPAALVTADMKAGNNWWMAATVLGWAAVVIWSAYFAGARRLCTTGSGRLPGAAFGHILLAVAIVVDLLAFGAAVVFFADTNSQMAGAATIVKVVHYGISHIRVKRD